jgi:quercetin dioxygenase-like cupin family protein
MHTTDTIDFVTVISGAITLEVDDDQRIELRSGDCVVQHGNRHAWRNTGPGPCTLVITMVGAEREG